MSMYCQSYTAGSLEDYLEIISFLNDCMLSRHSKNHTSQVRRMWYRGHEKHDYMLLPSLQRNSKGTQARYDRDHLREELRYQHFRSKCTQLVDTSPETKIEWLEILQHHLGSTRLMDWSESALSALMFALEAFIDPTENRELNYRRVNMTPCIWVLDPVGVNQHIYDTLTNRKDLIAGAVRDILVNPQETTSFCKYLSKQMANKRHAYFENSDEGGLNGIVCLSVIENERRANAERLYNLLRYGEFNPFFYLLLRFYSDGLTLPMNALPPLAIVHPYHSSRIQSQHGVFTVTPHYHIEPNQVGGPLDTRPMEKQPMINDCLYRIDITRPAKVAKELLTIGERRVNLYPELDIYVRDMEMGKWQV